MHGDEMSGSLDFASLERLGQSHGDSFFVLDGARFSDNFLTMRKAFRDYYPDVRIGYSYKTNYTPQLCRIVHELGG